MNYQTFVYDVFQLAREAQIRGCPDCGGEISRIVNIHSVRLVRKAHSADITLRCWTCGWSETWTITEPMDLDGLIDD